MWGATAAASVCSRPGQAPTDALDFFSAPAAIHAVGPPFHFWPEEANFYFVDPERRQPSKVAFPEPGQGGQTDELDELRAAGEGRPCLPKD